MLPEIAFFKLLLKQDNYKKYYALIDVDRYQFPELSVLYKTLKVYFEKYPKDSTLDEYASFFFGYYPKLKKEQIDAYQAIFKQINDSSVQDVQAQDLLSEVRQRSLAVQLADAALRYSEGKIDRQSFLQNIRECSPEVDGDVQETTQFVTDDLGEILDQTVLTNGLRWRLKTLNRSLGSLRKGDFGFVFARPETGKTTFLASEVTYFATQTDKPIIWFNNEEQGNKVKLRCYQAALGVPREYLISNRKQAHEDFLRVTKGNIKLVDSGALFRSEVERILESIRSPSLIIFDQIDKIRGFDADRNDLVMGSIYQWGRELAKSVAPVIGICQADGSGDGVKWLSMNNVAEAKTAKQAEADWILGIGRTYSEELESVRHFYLSKNKLAGDNDSDASWRHAKWDVLIQPEIARYKDLGA